VPERQRSGDTFGISSNSAASEKRVTSHSRGRRLIQVRSSPIVTR
jgi:hypothetical protein